MRGDVAERSGKIYHLIRKERTAGTPAHFRYIGDGEIRMLFELYHPFENRVFRGQRGTSSAFGHTFGGAAEYFGLVPASNLPPVQLLFRLNTTDPAVGVRLSEAKWLPLLCAIRYGACALGYRVISNQCVEILRIAEARPWIGFPYDNFPDQLQASPLAIQERQFDPSNPSDVLYFGTVFGYGALTPEQYSATARFVESSGIVDMSDWTTGENYLQNGNCFPYFQGRPNEDCPNPNCSNHGWASSLRTVVIFQEDDSRVRELWGGNAGSLQIIYQVCPLCAAIQTTNQAH